MREKLIELVFNAWLDTTTENGCVPTAVQIADYLIDNGVIVPPVKVGQTIYLVVTGIVREFKVTYFYFAQEEYTNTTFMQMEAEDENSANFVFASSDVGKTVFLTREEAEAAEAALKKGD